jgi:hypothetical protein
MRSVKTIYIILFFSILFFGCRKEAIDINPDMEGSWRSYPSSWDNDIINIGTGQSTYYQHQLAQGQRPKNYSGKAKIKDDILYIGKFSEHIDFYPGYDTTGNNIMIVQGITYYGAQYPGDVFTRVSNDTTYFTWRAYSGGDEKMVMDYKPSSSSTWETKEFTKNDYTTLDGQVKRYITGLLPATTYDWRMKSVNGEGSAEHSSKYTPVQTFTTN